MYVEKADGQTDEAHRLTAQMEGPQGLRAMEPVA